MRAIMLGALAVAGCNQILGNGNFAGPGGSIDASADASADAPPGTVDATPPDASMVCQAMSLPPTTIQGKVFAPNGTLPLANALVYIPKATPDALPSGVHCGCIPATGGVVTSMVSRDDGSFTLTDPPSGPNVPLVIQVGKWRRQIVIPNVAMCAETDLTADQTRLPKNGTEGDMPMIAVSTGGADQLECLLRKVGVDDTEFGTAGAPVHVQMFTDPTAPGVTMGPGGSLAPQAALVASLSSFDHVMFSCPGQVETPASADAGALTNYADAGGQVFLEHFHNAWIAASPEWRGVAGFVTGSGPLPQTVTVTIDSTFDGAQRLAGWMSAIGAAPGGQFSEMNGRNTAQTVDATRAQTWVHLDPAQTMGTTGDQVFTFPSASACGRVIFSDMHVTGTGDGQTIFPDECPAMPPAPQQEALEFLLFDEQTCAQ